MAPASLVTIDASEPIEKINQIIERDGGVIVANFLPAEYMKNAVTECKQQVSKQGFTISAMNLRLTK